MATNSKLVRELRKKLSLTSIQRTVLIGSILGDGCLLGGDIGRVNYRLQIAHSVKQKDYLYWKYKVFHGWTLSTPHYVRSNNSWRFRTMSHPELTAFQTLFYQDRKKIIPRNISELLTDPLALAIWFMDDGAKMKNHGIILNTQSFSIRENALLQNTLLENFNIPSTTHKDKNKVRLYIGYRFIDEFIRIVNPFILPSLKYKLPIAP